MQITKNYYLLVNMLESAKDFPLLFIRFILAYGFYITASKKIGNIESIAGWFEQLGMPFPTLNAYLATGTEAAGVFLLLFGLATRFISIPLIIVMLVAIITVHSGNGFNAGDNGFEIPLYYMVMLFTILIYGPGKISIDYFISRKVRK